MVVDDEPDIAKSVQRLLKQNGYEAVIAKNGQECLKKLPAEKPNLIIITM